MSIAPPLHEYTTPNLYVPRPLYRLSFRDPETTAHWGLFLPYEAAAPMGLLAHIGVQKEGSSGQAKPASGTIKENHRPRFEVFEITKSTVRRMSPIPNATVTEHDLRQAAMQVFNHPDYNKYKALTNNCQHWCIHVVMKLHEKHPETVGKEAVDFIKNQGGHEEQWADMDAVLGLLGNSDCCVGDKLPKTADAYFKMFFLKMGTLATEL
ncbi:hypothetical protein VSDG_02368 [Cytospora chrysosperma]|uniref:PPPDE domain-containing protein n=1 Tax=Cytospora chrysosperma TaxID=252740 RepID=A0A423WFD0_CYTCH|nr:hypothetical protein VSDG_02368 [Valsa sordida]